MEIKNNYILFYIKHVLIFVCFIIFSCFWSCDSNKTVIKEAITSCPWSLLPVSERTPSAEIVLALLGTRTMDSRRCGVDSVIISRRSVAGVGPNGLR